ncbi:MAG TPA: HAD family hydrolase [Nannocystis sp.]|jgi:HAD superfamily hydrolase (TIGR01490 family)
MSAAHDQREDVAPPAAGKVGAFFDVDHTLLDVNSGARWLRHAWRTGQTSSLQALRALGWLVRYRLALLDLEAVSALVARDYRGYSAADLDAEARSWFRRDIEAHVCIEGRARVADHLAKGHVVALLTSGTRFSVTPLAELLGVTHLLCTELEVEAGKLTGRHIAPACAGAGKVVYGERFAAEHGIDLSRSYFYTDSYSDLPMLERVGCPRVVNPDPRLKQRARSRGWEIERWTAY